MIGGVVLGSALLVALILFRWARLAAMAFVIIALLFFTHRFHEWKTRQAPIEQVAL